MSEPPFNRPRRLPGLTGLRAFDALYRTQSINAAADDLAVTPGAISRQLKQLEDTLGQPLFDRTGGRLALTEVGRAYAVEIGGAFDLIEKATTDLTTGARQNELVVTCPPSFHFCWLLPRLPSFEAEHRHIRVIVHTSLSTHERNIRPDAMVGVGHWPADETLRQRKFMANHSGPVMAPKFKGAVRQDGPPLADIRHLRLRPEPHIWHEWYEDAGVEEAPAPDEAAMDHLFLTIEAARAGLGAAIAPYSYVAPDIENGTLIAPFGFLERKVPYYLAWPAAPAPKPTLALFTDWLVTEGRKTPEPPHPA